MTESKFVFPELTASRRKTLLHYAHQVLGAQQQMTAEPGRNILHYTLDKKRRHMRMNHYPKGDRIDKSTGAQYFYHCHRENLQQAEHGHFHCFLRYAHVPKRIKPSPLLDWDKYIDNPMTHIVAVAMNQFGQPIRLFTVNRWVTSEIWYDAIYMQKMISRFKMTLSDTPSYWHVLDKWVEGMMHLFSPQISWLHLERDKLIEHHKIKNMCDNPYVDHDLEDLSEIHIDLKTQIEWVMMHA
jgi:hypothetical protein